MNAKKSFDELFEALRKRHGLNVRAHVTHVDEEYLVVRFTAKPWWAAFELWRGPGLYETAPANHPMLEKRGDSWMINGDTGYVTYLMSPVGFVSLPGGVTRPVFGNAKPWCLRGRKLDVEIFLDRLSTSEGQEDLASFLSDMLRKDGRWVSVSGDLKRF